MAEECNFVEFRGISSHYVASEGIPASFRYPIDSFQPTERDWVGLFRADDSPRLDQFTARVYCGDPSVHRPCDGGIWKSGKVLINAGDLPDDSSGLYLLLYVSDGESIAGRSGAFTICRDMSEFPSIQIQSMEDHVFIEKLRDHSLTSDGGLSSFTMVTEELTSLRGKDLLESDPRNGRCSPDLEVISYPDLTTSEEQPHGSEDLEETPSGDVEEAPSGDLEEDPSGDQIEALSRDQQALLYGSGVDQTCVESLPDLHAELTEGYTQEGSNQLVDDPQECVAGSHDGDDIPGDEVFLRQLSLSESVVMVEGMSQGEAWWFKNNNRELRAKLRKLTGILETMRKEKSTLADQLTQERWSKEQLLERISEAELEMSRFESVHRELEDRNKQLLEEKSSLEKKVQELEAECAMVSQHCSRVLAQVEQCETELKVVCSEKAVLEEKTAHIQKQLKDARRQLDGRRHEGRSKHEVQSKDWKQEGLEAGREGYRKHEGLSKHDSRKEEHTILEGVKRHVEEGHTKHEQSSSKEGHMKLKALKTQESEEVQGLRKRERPSKQGPPKLSNGEHPIRAPKSSSHAAQGKTLVNGGISVLMMGAGDIYSKGGGAEVPLKVGGVDIHRKGGGGAEVPLKVGGVDIHRKGDSDVQRKDARAKDISSKRQVPPAKSSKKPLLSEDRVQEITSRLKGNASVFECPVCHQLLHSRETEFSATLHIEHCLALHEGQ